MRNGKCSRCKLVRMVNDCTIDEAHLGEFCAECFEVIEHDEPRRNRTNSGSGLEHNDPGFDDVIRALEEDR